MRNYRLGIQQTLVEHLALGWFAIKQARLARLIRQVRSQHLTYLDTPALIDLVKAVHQIEQHQTPGILIEAGCALGGSALVIAASKIPRRSLSLYDVFGMIPPPSNHDSTDVHQRYEEIVSGRSSGIGSEPYYGYQKDLYSNVLAIFTRFGYPVDQNTIHLIKGLYEDTLRVDEPVALAHIDCDWYESVIICLKRITPQLVPGGILVIDDYNRWSGCRQAVDDFFMTSKDLFHFDQKSRLHITKL